VQTDQGFQALPEVYQPGGETWPTLYKKNSNGSYQQWTINVKTTPVGATDTWGVITKTYGQVDGKLQVAEDVVREGKNVGRANETGPVDQARAEAQSQWEGKLKKGYVKTMDDAVEGKTDAIIQGGVSPMLAHKYADHGHKISYPAFAQPKLDGHRCVAVVTDGECVLWSRTRKRITGVPHIAAQLERLFPGPSQIVLDGELYNHDYHDNFEALTSMIRSATPKPGHEVVQYWIYDAIGDENQAGRLQLLDDTIGLVQTVTADATSLVLVPTELVQDEEEMVAVFGAYLANNFEGLMLRNQFAPYKNSRSYDLQKVKIMQDAEFPVIRVEEGRGRMAGLALFVVTTPEGKEFRVKMEGALEDLRKYADDPSLAVGRQLTVRFQNLSQDGIPRFPVGVRFREDV
jgi:DNA ligase-1